MLSVFCVRLSVLCQELKLAYKNDNDVYLRPEDIARLINK